jgi:hypothetical protein
VQLYYNEERQLYRAKRGQSNSKTENRGTLGQGVQPALKAKTAILVEPIHLAFCTERNCLSWFRSYFAGLRSVATVCQVKPQVVRCYKKNTAGILSKAQKMF